MTSLDVRAVRGPRTRKFLLECNIKCPAIYGDPAIIMPEIYNPENIKKDRDYILIQHFAETKAETNLPTLNILTNNYKHFIDEICRSRVVISSSLHGIILAETYGVPAVWLKLNNMDPVKYYDWYESTGRYGIEPTLSLEDALACKPPELPNLENMRRQIKDVFPYDLYQR
jgi:pyruvyltransferase